MTKTLHLLLAALLIIGLLTACSSEPAPIDPSAIEVSLSTVPAPAVSGKPVELKADFTGAEFADSTQVTFDIRVDDKPKMVDAENKGNGVFMGTYTFEKAGLYEVYLHLYVDDLHITKKKQVDVQ
ncbi:FixH family protein [Paenibacillus eucommiae]|uniref:YtkA-like domain-containing protein n=1 Tax=Paenibacillus eucommiae TaxID=1355755 RepID=A0ABS4IPN0_9BACL|nr:FixH family protein [Paenibacillus eucommiae]MBP1989524.1 hypothetical protein [Paenibacillus eucommiae]